VISQRIEAVYDRIAAEYAASDGKMLPSLVERGTLFLSSIGPGARVLDVGCGAGRDMAWMEAQGFHVTGVDLSTGMLDQARRLVQGKLLHMDMSHLAFPPASFEGIWCNASLLHIPKAQAPEVLGQMHRVLIPGGWLYFSLQEGDGERWEVTRFGVERFFARYVSEEAEALLSQTGFSVDKRYQDQTGLRPWLNFLARATN
jgi:ubiquinone/menaquinone biosynthesis C-methylase UbiE